MPYIAVDDVDARVKKATAAGAKLMRPLFDIPGIGRIAILREPGGAGVGWMTPGLNMETVALPAPLLTELVKATDDSKKSYTPRERVARGRRRICKERR